MSNSTSDLVKGVVRYVRTITLDDSDKFRMATPQIESLTHGHGARPIRIIIQRNFTFGHSQNTGTPFDAAGNVAKPKKKKEVADEIDIWYENLRPDLMVEGYTYTTPYAWLSREDQVRVDEIIKNHPLPDESHVSFK